MPVPAVERPVFVEVLSVHEGQNSKDVTWAIGPNQAALLQNIDTRDVGRRARRRGVASIGARTDTPGGLWRAQDTTLSQEAVFGVYGGAVYVLPGAGIVSERASDASMTSMLHMGVEGRWLGRRATFVCSAQADDSDISLASGLLAITDDNRHSQAASMAPRCATWFQSRLWVAHNARGQTDETVWWSELLDGLSYSSFNSLQPEAGVGGRVTGLLGVRGFTPSILTFKERAVAVIEPYWGASSKLIPAAADALDTTKTSIRLLSGKYGCVATKSIQFIPGAPHGDVWFLAHDGVRAVGRAADDAFAGVTPAISDPIKDVIERINWTYAHKAVSAVNKQRYYLGVPLDGATENTHTLVYDLQNQSWRVDTWRAKDFVEARATQTDYDLYLQYNTQTGDCSVTALTTAYHIFRGLVGALDPSGVPVVYQEDTRAFWFDDLKIEKTWDQLLFTVRNDSTETATATLLYNIDGKGWVTAFSAAWSGGVQDPVLGVTPLPWAATTGVVRTLKFSLADAPPGHFLQIRYIGGSDRSTPTVHNIAVGARPLPHGEYDNAIA